VESKRFVLGERCPRALGQRRSVEDVERRLAGCGGGGDDENGNGS
jgi:hypothetical protein